MRERLAFLINGPLECAAKRGGERTPLRQFSRYTRGEMEDWWVGARERSTVTRRRVARGEDFENFMSNIGGLVN